MEQENIPYLSERFVAAERSGDFANLVAAISTRRGGLSAAPYATLNLGKSTPDDPEIVKRNRRLFYADLGLNEAQVAFSGQVHGCDIRDVQIPDFQQGYDGLTTNRKGVFLAVSTADCVPILLWDPVLKTCAALHAGWKGTVGEIAKKGVQALSDRYGSEPENVYAWIGPCICEKTFEVNNDVAQHFGEAVKRFEATTGKWFVDLKNENRRHLMGAGVPEAQIEVSALSTVLHNVLFFSHRKEKGATGRMFSVVGWQE